MSDSAEPVARFDLRSLTLSSPPPSDGLTFAPNRDGLTIDGWMNGTNPTLNGRTLPVLQYDVARSFAIAPDAKRFFLGSSLVSQRSTTRERRNGGGRVATRFGP